MHQLSQFKIVTLEGVSEIYGDRRLRVDALKDVNLEIDRGEFIGIMGPSGSGKTTLLNVIGCLQRPTEGRIMLRGQDISSLSAGELAGIRARVLGFIFQSRSLLPGLSVLKNVELPFAFLSGKERPGSKSPKDRAMKLLGLVGLEKRAEHRPNELSAGEYQRVAVARALMNDPPVILADEPTGNLDSQTGRELIVLLNELNESGKTLVVVTHDPEVVSSARIRMTMRDGILRKDWEL